MNVKVIMNTTAHYRPAAKARLVSARRPSEWRLRAERAKTSRPSFTLVELLVTVAVIGIMAGMILFALSGVRRDSLNAKTRSTIKKINEIILHRWEEFRYRGARINIPDDFLQRIPQSSGSQLAGQVPISPREAARTRMIVLRDIMRMEMPDRYSDILYPPTIYKTAAFSGDNGPPSPDFTNDSLVVTPQNAIPSRSGTPIYNNFRAKVTVAGPIENYSGAVTPSVLSQGTLAFQGAEWLYQIVASSNYNGSNALELFHPSEIGDVDGDGMPEFIDAWGQPIRFLRWPAGYGVVDASSLPVAQRQAYIVDRKPADSILNYDVSIDVNGNYVFNRQFDRQTEMDYPADPFDPMHTDWRWRDPGFNDQRNPTPKPWMLLPLIVSAGADGMFDIQFDEATPLAYAEDVWTRGTDSPAHTSRGPYFFPDPYRNFYDISATPVTAFFGGLGQFIDEDGSAGTIGTTDNITNYEIILE